MSAEGIITLGIGSAPANLKWFILLGLNAAAPVITAARPITIRERDADLTLVTRSAALTLRDRT